MTATLEAIYENGSLKLLEALPLAEHTRVRIRLETSEADELRAVWLAGSEQSLLKTWENSADDVYNELLAP